jgi:hypothetical protein
MAPGVTRPTVVDSYGRGGELLALPESCCSYLEFGARVGQAGLDPDMFQLDGWWAA